MTTITKNNETMVALVGATIGQIGGHKYGRMRRNLDKSGFSEIGLFEQVSHHLTQIGESPTAYAPKMETLLDGCVRNALFVKSNGGKDFSYLKQHYFRIRHGDLSKDEPKSEEQKGSFLCNRCFHVKRSIERSAGKSTRFTCKKCVSKAQMASNEKKALRDKQIDQSLSDEVRNLSDEQLDQQVNGNALNGSHSGETNSNEQASPKIGSALTEALAAVHDAHRGQSKNSIKQLGKHNKAPKQETPEPTFIPEIIAEEVPEVEPKPTKRPFTITSVIADENECEITLKCTTQELVDVMALLKGK
ncbi:hypothetical protein ABXV18_27010 [Vibrio owensii]|uniref:hypothetical protein n=1 Tax=Vibrio owensii TaxID=696485 RepID=UPI003395200C